MEISGEYSIYDMPSYKEMESKGIALANPKGIKSYYTFYDGEVLVGFINLLNKGDAVKQRGLSPLLHIYKMKMEPWEKRID